MISRGLLRFEANPLSDITEAEAPYLRQLMKDRKKILDAVAKEARFNRWSKTRAEREFSRVVRQEYIDRGWQRKKTLAGVGRTSYNADPWKMLKDYRQKAIDSGDYFPDKKRVGRDTEGNITAIHISKGNVMVQKQRYMDKLRQDPERWQKLLMQKSQQKARARQKRLQQEH